MGQNPSCDPYLNCIHSTKKIGTLYYIWAIIIFMMEKLILSSTYTKLFMVYKTIFQMEVVQLCSSTYGSPFINIFIWAIMRVKHITSNESVSMGKVLTLQKMCPHQRNNMAYMIYMVALHKIVQSMNMEYNIFKPCSCINSNAWTQIFFSYANKFHFLSKLKIVFPFFYILF